MWEHGKLLELEETPRDTVMYELVQRFVNGDDGRFLFGQTDYAKSVIAQIAVDGIIDETTNKKSYQGIPIVEPENIPRDSLVLSCVVDGRPITARDRLGRLHLNNIDYYSFLKYTDLKIRAIPFIGRAPDNIRENLHKYRWIYKILQDDESKEHFYNIVNFRNSFDLRFMEDFELKIDRQYFESFVPLEDCEVFVDAGGYDGNTMYEFVQRRKNLKRGLIFEPDPWNYEIITDRFRDMPEIQCHNIGLYNQCTVLSFNHDGSASSISESGELSISVDKLDHMVNEPVDFIKMDIEGAEKEALLGAQETIRKNHPILAICVYHKKDDMWKIPELVFSFRQDYKVYLRHYSEGILETVMFFVPDNAVG